MNDILKFVEGASYQELRTLHDILLEDYVADQLVNEFLKTGMIIDSETVDFIFDNLCDRSPRFDHFANVKGFDQLRVKRAALKHLYDYMTLLDYWFGTTVSGRANELTTSNLIGQGGVFFKESDRYMNMLRNFVAEHTKRHDKDAIELELMERAEDAAKLFDVDPMTITEEGRKELDALLSKYTQQYTLVKGKSVLKNGRPVLGKDGKPLREGEEFYLQSTPDKFKTKGLYLNTGHKLRADFDLMTSIERYINLIEFGKEDIIKIISQVDEKFGNVEYALAKGLAFNVSQGDSRGDTPNKLKEDVEPIQLEYTVDGETFTATDPGKEPKKTKDSAKYEASLEAVESISLSNMSDISSKQTLIVEDIKGSIRSLRQKGYEIDNYKKTIKVGTEFIPIEKYRDILAQQLSEYHIPKNELLSTPEKPTYTTSTGETADVTNLQPSPIHSYGDILIANYKNTLASLIASSIVPFQDTNSPEDNKSSILNYYRNLLQGEVDTYTLDSNQLNEIVQFYATILYDHIYNNSSVLSQVNIAKEDLIFQITPAIKKEYSHPSKKLEKRENWNVETISNLQDYSRLYLVYQDLNDYAQSYQSLASEQYLYQKYEERVRSSRESQNRATNLKEKAKQVMATLNAQPNITIKQFNDMIKKSYNNDIANFESTKMAEEWERSLLKKIDVLADFMEQTKRSFNKYLTRAEYRAIAKNLIRTTDNEKEGAEDEKGTIDEKDIDIDLSGYMGTSINVLPVYSEEKPESEMGTIKLEGLIDAFKERIDKYRTDLDIILKTKNELLTTFGFAVGAIEREYQKMKSEIELNIKEINPQPVNMATEFKTLEDFISKEKNNFKRLSGKNKVTVNSAKSSKGKDRTNFEDRLLYLNMSLMAYRDKIFNQENLDENKKKELSNDSLIRQIDKIIKDLNEDALQVLPSSLDGLKNSLKERHNAILSLSKEDKEKLPEGKKEELDSVNLLFQNINRYSTRYHRDVENPPKYIQPLSVLFYSLDNLVKSNASLSELKDMVASFKALKEYRNIMDLEEVNDILSTIEKSIEYGLKRDPLTPDRISKMVNPLVEKFGDFLGKGQFGINQTYAAESDEEEDFSDEGEIPEDTGDDIGKIKNKKKETPPKTFDVNRLLESVAKQFGADKSIINKEDPNVDYKEVYRKRDQIQKIMDQVLMPQQKMVVKVIGDTRNFSYYDPEDTRSRYVNTEKVDQNAYVSRKLLEDHGDDLGRMTPKEISDLKTKILKEKGFMSNVGYIAQTGDILSYNMVNMSPVDVMDRYKNWYSIFRLWKSTVNGCRRSLRNSAPKDDSGAKQFTTFNVSTLRGPTYKFEEQGNYGYLIDWVEGTSPRGETIETDEVDETGKKKKEYITSKQGDVRVVKEMVDNINVLTSPENLDQILSNAASQIYGHFFYLFQYEKDLRDKKVPLGIKPSISLMNFASEDGLRFDWDANTKKFLMDLISRDDVSDFYEYISTLMNKYNENEGIKNKKDVSIDIINLIEKLRKDYKTVVTAGESFKGNKDTFLFKVTYAPETLSQKEKMDLRTMILKFKHNYLFQVPKK